MNTIATIQGVTGNGQIFTAQCAASFEPLPITEVKFRSSSLWRTSSIRYEREINVFFKLRRNAVLFSKQSLILYIEGFWWRVTKTSIQQKKFRLKKRLIRRWILNACAERWGEQRKEKKRN